MIVTEAVALTLVVPIVGAAIDIVGVFTYPEPRSPIVIILLIGILLELTDTTAVAILAPVGAVLPTPPPSLISIDAVPAG